MEPSPSSHPSFKECFPKFYELMNAGEFDQIFYKHQHQEDMWKVYGVIEQQIFEKCKDELSGILGQALEDCMMCGFCHIHTLIATYNVLRDDRFGGLSGEIQNQLLWAALCHDLGKRGKADFEGKDHIHPFRSAAYFVNILKNNNLIKDELRDKADELSELVFNAHTDIQYEWFQRETRRFPDKVCDQMHDHSKLEDIFNLLEEVADGSLFIKNVFVVILFHQSIWGIKDFEPMKRLEDEEIVEYKEYLNEDVLNMLDIFMHCDSYAYTIIGESEKIVMQYRKEISTEIKRISCLLGF
ncbi:unnamed protein product [Moneuplotes crassus]|uniref:HD domain-containing protein n=1 Tax=Euplotes crassus TaxID=5936 RepID=A0AAD1XDP5_EUPCR|nr:unnamed protein product [Moneuplotes crassus]